LEHLSDIRVSFYYFIKEMNQRYYQISVWEKKNVCIRNCRF
jgi:hypothetical protein